MLEAGKKDQKREETERSPSSGKDPASTTRKDLILYRVKVKAEKGGGTEQEVYVQATNVEQIWREYKEKGYDILEIRELVSKGPVTLAKIGSDQKAEFCYLLSDLLKAGIPFKQALNTILGETNRATAAAIPIIIKDLDEGKSVIEAFSRHPGIFDEVMIAVLQTGEKSGEWSVPLEILGRNFEKDANLRSTVKLALLYPLIVLGIALAIVTGLAFYAFPNFIMIYEEMGAELPFATRITLSAVSLMTGLPGLLFALALVAVGFGLWKYYQTRTGKLQFQNLFMRLGPIRKMLEGQSMALFSRTLSILLSAGELLHDSLVLAAKSATLEKHRKALLGMVSPIRRGEDPAVALDMNFAFTQAFKQQFVVGAATGHLDVSLARVAEYYEKDVERQIAKVSKMIEPALIVLLGGIIAWLVISMYMPLFGLLSSMGS